MRAPLAPAALAVLLSTGACDGSGQPDGPDADDELSGGAMGHSIPGGGIGDGEGGESVEIEGGTAPALALGGAASTASGYAGGGQAAAGAPAAGASGLDPVCADGGPADGATCARYCDDWFAVCSDNASTNVVFADETACLLACAELLEEQLCCRAYHAAQAPERPSTHCAHAAGFRTCP